ncbi:MAG: hypothetical protein V1872_01365 [bacterium]
MHCKTTLEKIEKEVKYLTPQEHLKLMEIIIHHLKKIEPSNLKSVDLDKLYGIGKGLWEGEDAQDYVNQLREDRI